MYLTHNYDIIRHPQEQSCKVCGVRDGLSFHVPDRIWEAAVPSQFKNLVVCLRCFDGFAWERRIDYHRNLRILHFAGRQACFRFRVVRFCRGSGFPAIASLLFAQAFIAEFTRCWF